jgi:hypothetical protein
MNIIINFVPVSAIIDNVHSLELPSLGLGELGQKY